MVTYETAAVPVARRPLHPLLFPIPAACFVGALLTDIVYWRTAEMLWTNFSAWLVSAGFVLALLAAIILVVDLFAGHFVRANGSTWLYAVGNLAALVLAALNMLVHTRDAWTSVVPWGVTLSAAIVVILLATAWVGWPALYRRDVEVIET